MKFIYWNCVFAGVFLVFLVFFGRVNSGKRMFSSFRQTVNARKITRIPEFSSHILDWQFRVNSRKPVLPPGVRGVFLAFAFSVGLNIKKKRVFSIFCIPNPIHSRLFPKFHDSKLLFTFKVWETKSHISLPKEIGEDENTFKVDFKNNLFQMCKNLQVFKDSLYLTLVSVYLIKSIQYF